MPSQPRLVHIRKTPYELFAKPQNPRGIEGIANIASVCVEAFLTTTTPVKLGFYSRGHRVQTHTRGRYSQNPQNPKIGEVIEQGRYR